MGKSKQSSGQPIRCQILSCISSDIIKQSGKQHKSNRYYKLPASQVALIYKDRWMIELLFKQIKQNFPIRYFWGNSENAIKIQVYCVLIAQLLMVYQEKDGNQKIFRQCDHRYQVPFDELLFEFIKDTYAAWRKINGPPLATLTN